VLNWIIGTHIGKEGKERKVQEFNVQLSHKSNEKDEKIKKNKIK